ncbi:uncharacterized protein LOC131432627 [Malaya genurostris]|uniref:uncharacterized protein LOC131432627 n=1 Tax=Malaya genurostris TaxID=325434 RepID=UPI0026F3DBB6|nr:uncharacterized protein LOC131432627 [Malaya genurostris]
MPKSNYELLQTAKFSIRSPRNRNAKRVQQELVRASERKSRSRKTVIERCLKAANQRIAKVAQNFLPQHDESIQNAVDLFITSELQKMAMSVKDIRNNTSLIQTSIQKFFDQPLATQQQFVKASILSQANRAKTHSDPFLIFLDLHKKQSKSKRRSDSAEIGPFVVNLEQAESGEQADPTRFRLEDQQHFVSTAKQLWNRMSPDLKLPFFVQAFLVTHFPESLDHAL